ncbi:MAG: hypothetical protein P4L74_06165 [Candidatus Doudnabacteria bacterium]|nr:hypothetical protein [Candidatus Doudnabacteria bacterium]
MKITRKNSVIFGLIFAVSFIVVYFLQNYILVAFGLDYFNSLGLAFLLPLCIVFFSEVAILYFNQELPIKEKFVDFIVAGISFVVALTIVWYGAVYLLASRSYNLEGCHAANGINCGV